MNADHLLLSAPSPGVSGLPGAISHKPTSDPLTRPKPKVHEDEDESSDSETVTSSSDEDELDTELDALFAKYPEEVCGERAEEGHLVRGQNLLPVSATILPAPVTAANAP